MREIARSRVDIIWMTQFSTVKRINDVKANIISNSTVYNDYLVTTPLSVNGNSIVYYCGVSINTPSGVHFFNGSIVIDFNSKFCTYIRTYVCMYICMYVCMYVCMCVCVCVSVCVYVCMYVCMYVHLCVIRSY